jgi:hypothetical protein
VGELLKRGERRRGRARWTPFFSELPTVRLAPALFAFQVDSAARRPHPIFVPEHETPQLDPTHCPTQPFPVMDIYLL